MENQEQPKRRHKKHKEDFKITISYKPNTSLKGYTYDDNHGKIEGISLAPLYVEIRVKRQRSYFRSSVWSSVDPSDFDNFMENPVVKCLVEQERKSILVDLKEYIAKNEDEFLINNWLAAFRQKTTIAKVLVSAFSVKLLELATERNIDSKPLFELIHNDNPLRSMFNLSLFLTELGIRIFDPIIEATQAYYRLIELLRDIKPFEWGLNSQMLITGGYLSLSINNLIDNEFIIESIKTFEEKNAEVLLHNLDILTRFHENFTKINV